MDKYTPNLKNILKNQVGKKLIDKKKGHLRKKKIIHHSMLINNLIGN